MILVIDNYDSFTWNLVHYLQELGAEVRVVRNDALTAKQALASGADAFMISPGPGTPYDAGISMDLVRACVRAKRPLIGICLGHQAIAAAFSGRVKQADRLMHGKTSQVSHDSSGLFHGLPSPFIAARYHSLDIDSALPRQLIANAWADDGSIMGLRHRKLPIHGVQFHPESIVTAHGHDLLRNFLIEAGSLER